MLNIIDWSSRLEIACLLLSIVFVILFSATLWILVVGTALLYTFGVKLPSASSISIGTGVAIGFIGGLSGALDLTSVAFIVQYFYKRRAPRKHPKGKLLELYQGIYK